MGRILSFGKYFVRLLPRTTQGTNQHTRLLDLDPVPCSVLRRQLSQRGTQRTASSRRCSTWAPATPMLYIAVRGRACVDAHACAAQGWTQLRHGQGFGAQLGEEGKQRMSRMCDPLSSFSSPACCNVLGCRVGLTACAWLRRLTMYGA